MGSWHARASAASITGACVFAVVTGAGAVLVGDWYGSHHGTVVTEFVTSSASPAHGHAAAGSVHPAAAGSPSAAGSQVQADVKAARKAGTSPATRTHHSVKPAAVATVYAAGMVPSSAAPAPTTVATSTSASSVPSSADPSGTTSSGSGNTGTGAAGSTGTASSVPLG